MKKEVTICDGCGKELKNGNFSYSEALSSEYGMVDVRFARKFLCIRCRKMALRRMFSYFLNIGKRQGSRKRPRRNKRRLLFRN